MVGARRPPSGGRRGGKVSRLLRRPGSLILVAVAGLCLLPAARPAAAQTTDLIQLEAEYRSARADLESAIAARDAVQRAYERALDAVNAATDEGEGALQAAMRAFLRQSDELDRLDRRVDDRFQALQEAQDAYLDALDARREAMEDALAEARTAEEEREIQIRLRDLIRQYENLEAKTNILSVITAPVTSGAELGRLVIDLGDETIASERLLALETIPEGGFWKRMTDSVALWFHDFTEDDEP